MLKTPCVAEIKAALQQQTREELVDLCLRLSRFKRDNKELLGFLLFEAHDLEGYIQLVKELMTEEFTKVNTSGVWMAKKTIRKILRLVNKYAKYAGNKEVEVALHIHYLREIRTLPEALMRAPVLDKLYRSEEQKVRKLIRSLHEDLQHDFFRLLSEFDSGE